MLTSKGPTDWHSGQEPGFTSWFWDCEKGPSTKLHLLQLYLTMLSWGRTPVQLVTTPLVRISWFRCSCLREGEKAAQLESQQRPQTPGPEGPVDAITRVYQNWWSQGGRRL